MAQPRASSQWQLSAPMPPRQVDNPALAGVPGKPRCEHCNMLLDNGRCVEPDCRKFQPAAQSTDEERGEASTDAPADAPEAGSSKATASCPATVSRKRAASNVSAPPKGKTPRQQAKSGPAEPNSHAAAEAEELGRAAAAPAIGEHAAT